MDFERLRIGEIVAGLGGVALLVFMFLPWFDLGDLDDTSGWDSLMDWDGFLVLLTGLAAIALALLATAGRRVNVAGLPRGVVTSVLGSLTVVMIFWRLVLADFGDVKVGGILGLLAAIAVAAGAIMSLREAGFEALVADEAPTRAAAPGERSS